MTDPATKNLKITFLTTSFPRFDGDFAGNFVYKYAQELSRSGCQVKVIAPHDPLVTDPSQWCDVEARYFKYFFPERSQSLAYGAGILSRIKQNGLRLFLIPFFLASFFYSALHAGRDSDLMHAFWAPAGCIAILASLFKKVPVVINLWGSDTLLFKIPGVSFILRIMLRRASGIICESDQFRNQLEQIGLPRNIISVIPNGIDVETFKLQNKTSSRNALQLSQDKIIILNVSSMSPVKGQKYLIESIPEIVNKFKNIQFVFVGDGEVRDELESLVNTLGLAPYVLFAGVQKATQIPHWLNSADIFVLPSISEGNPNALLEAMACGLPVIATAVGGIPEMMEDGREGLLSPPKSSSSLAKNIIALVRNKALRYQMGQNGLQTVLAKYANWKVQSAQLKGIYEDLIFFPAADKTQVLTLYYKHKPGGFCKRLKMKIEAYLENGWVVHYIAVEPFPYVHPNLIPHILPTPMQRQDTVLFWLYFFLTAPFYTAFIGLRNRINLISVFSPLYAALAGPAKAITRIPMLTFVRSPPHPNLPFSWRKSCLFSYCESVLEKMGLAFSDRILANSETVLEAITTGYPEARKLSGILYNHIEDDPFDAGLQKKRLVQEFSLTGHPFIIATSGLLQKLKNQECLLKAFADAQNSTSALMIVGEGDQKDNLQQLAGQLGIADRTIFTGWRNDAINLVQGADLFVFLFFQGGVVQFIVGSRCQRSALPGERHSRQSGDPAKPGTTFPPGPARHPQR